MKKIFTKILPLAIGLAGAASNFAAHDSTPEAAKTAGATATRPMDESKLSPASVKVVRLLQAGMDDKVIVAYVKSDPPPDSPSAEELVYLHELGVSTPVLTAMLTRAKTAPAALIPIPVASPAERVEVTSNYASVPGVPQQQVNGSTVISTPVSAPAAVIVQPQPARPTVAYTQAAPVYYESPAPVCYDTRPTFSFGLGLGHHGLFGSHHSGGHHGGYSGEHHGGGSRYGGHH